ncbi:MAG: tRNA 5-methoxyuridine(34)/uridine 5-oxyacetic acid(34) synthase CmoB [Pseudomonadota bacterium]
MTEHTPLSRKALHSLLLASPFASEADALTAVVPEHMFKHGDAQRWAQALGALPGIRAVAELTNDTVSANTTLDDAQHAQLRDNLQALRPWRKGPFRFATIDIDTEWRSDWKWQRIAPALGSLQGHRVLDVGGGNGYFSFRCAGAGAASVLNVDPTLLFYAQFLAAHHFLGTRTVRMVPTTFEALPGLEPFDTVLSMGVLYHRRSPFDHLADLRKRLKPGGQLVLETLVIEGGPTDVLVPASRYARMRNVYFLPSVAALKIWLERGGFANVTVADVTPTTIEEQRSTDWMPFESLAQSLDPHDSALTIEGYAAPLRATLTATS